MVGEYTEYDSDEVVDSSTDTVVQEKQWIADPQNELCKMLTGIDMRENPAELTSRMIEDRTRVFEKYTLKRPEELITSGENFDAYYKYILDFAKQENIPIRFVNKEDLPHGTHRDVGGFMMKDGTIGVVEVEGLSNSPEYRYYQGNIILHEVIHALQKKSGESMTQEQMEYEAYIGANLRDDMYLMKLKNPRMGMELFSANINQEVIGKILMSSLEGYYSQGVKQEDIPFMYK